MGYLLKILYFAVIALAKYNSSIDPRIIGGWKASIEQFPYHAAIVTWTPKVNILSLGSWRYKCGGVIIESHWILTAGHCLVQKGTREKFQISVAVGYDNIHFSFQYIFNWFTAVDHTVVHPCHLINFKGEPPVHDIGLVKLKNPIKYSAQVQRAVLPWKMRSVEDGQVVYTSGFGVIDAEGALENTELNAVNLTVINNTQCIKIYGHRLIDSSMVCVQGDNEDTSSTCRGDSGSGLTVERGNGLFTVIGINSWGAPCRVGGFPEVFMRVSYYLPWIRAVIRGRNFTVHC